MAAYLIGQIIIHDMGKFMTYMANTSAAIANDDADFSDLDHPERQRRAIRLGVAAVPQGRPFRAFGDARERLWRGHRRVADPRQRPRVGRDAEGRRDIEYALADTRHGYLVPAAGAVEVNGVRIEARD
jgi:hypothetical protein